MSSSELRTRRSIVLATGAGLLLAGCGFQLRRPPTLPFRSIALTGFAPRSPLAEELKRTLALQLRVMDVPADERNSADVVLHALVDTRERSVVAQTSSAQVRDVQLRLKLQFRAHTPAGRELLAPSILLLARDMSFNETAALAKVQEEGELYREMQSDVVQQVVRRLASIKL